MNLTAADPLLEAFLERVVLFGHLSEEQYIVYQILIRQDPYVYVLLYMLYSCQDILPLRRSL